MRIWWWEEAKGFVGSQSFWLGSWRWKSTTDCWVHPDFGFFRWRSLWECLDLRLFRFWRCLKPLDASKTRKSPKWTISTPPHFIIPSPLFTLLSAKFNLPQKKLKNWKKKLFGKLKNWKLACQYFTDKQHSKIDFDFCISIICCLCCCTTCCALLLQIYAFQQAVQLIFFRIFLGGRRGYGNWSILEGIHRRIRLW